MLDIEGGLSEKQKIRFKGLMNINSGGLDVQSCRGFSDCLGLEREEQNVIVYELDRNLKKARISSFNYGSGVQNKSVDISCSNIIAPDVMYNDLKQLRRRIRF